MRRNWLAHPRRELGFTLMELLVVMAIIGILATILVPNLLNSLAKARATSLIADFRVIESAALQFYTEKGRWPRRFNRRGLQHPELAPYLQGRVQWWTSDYKLRFDNTLNAKGEPRHREVGIGLSVFTSSRNDPFIYLLKDAWSGRGWAPRRANRFVFIISPGRNPRS